MENLKKVSEDYYISTPSANKDPYKPEPKAVEFELPGFTDCDFFYIERSKYQYAAFDGYTGLRLTGWCSNLISVGVEIIRGIGGLEREECAEEVYRGEFLPENIEKYGLCPRWEKDMSWLF